MVRPVLHTRRRGAGEGHLCTRGTGMRPALMQTCCRLPVLLDPCCNTAFLISLYSLSISIEILLCRYLSDFGTVPIFPVDPIGLKRRWLKIPNINTMPQSRCCTELRVAPVIIVVLASGRHKQGEHSESYII
jgi:hypothetical protein